MTAAPALTLPGLEAVYDALANAIDQAGPQRAELFLVKLALLNANALANPALFSSHIQSALQDLEPRTPLAPTSDGAA